MTETKSTVFGQTSRRFQSDNGAILSLVNRRGGITEDANVFITALWLRELRMRNLHQFAGFSQVQADALDFLQRASVQHKKFGRVWSFWSSEYQPEWATSLGADLDDTVVVLNELLKAELTCPMAIKQDLYRLLASIRMPSKTESAPKWANAGCYYTWIASDNDKVHHNVIDIGVNINVIALLATIGAANAPGYRDACKTIYRAIEWADGDATKWSAIAPYYHNAFELLHALDHAFECGASELIVARDLLKRQLEQNKLQPNGLLCSGAYDNTSWHCEAIDRLRNNPFEFLASSNNSTEEGRVCKYRIY